MNVTTTIEIPSAPAYFEGHFPGRPILPGVAEIALTLEAIAGETAVDISLQEIFYTRLRQIVLPGDSLDLTAKSVEGGRTRIELKREGVLVANGEWVLGLPKSVGESILPPTTAIQTSTAPPLDSLLPHRSPMRFLESILSENTESLSAIATIPMACPQVKNSNVPAVVGLEAAAQAAAAWEALQRSRSAGMAAPRVGYLVALREVLFFAERIPANKALFVTLKLEATAPPLSHYRVALYLEGKLLVQGLIATFLKEDGE